MFNAFFSIVAGEYIISVKEGEEQYLKTDDIIIHPGEIDVALLHLEQPPQFNQYIHTNISLKA